MEVSYKYLYLNGMKRIITICALVSAILACQKQEQINDNVFVETSINIGVPTKTTMAADGSMAWKTSDILSVFTDTDDADGISNYKFTMLQTSDNGKGASFAGSVASNSDRRNIYVMYPHGDSRANGLITQKDVTLYYPVSHGYFETRLVMAGKGQVVGNDFSDAVVNMQYLTWVWDIEIENPEQKPISSVILNAAENIFPYNGQLDLTADELKVMATHYTSSLQYNFATPTTDESVLARFSILPMEAHPEVALEIIVNYEDGAKEIFARKAPAVATVAGKRYHNTYTLGEGEYDDMPDGYTYVEKGRDLRAILNGLMSDENTTEIKLYLESSPSEALTYSLGSSRIDPKKSIYIRSNPENIKPKISSAVGSTFEVKTPVSGLKISFKNVEISNTGSGDLLQVSVNGVSVDLLEIDNCLLQGFQHSIVRTAGQDAGSGFTGAVFNNIRINNSILRMKSPAYTDRALLFFQKTGDSMGTVSVTNSTFENTFAIILNKMYSASGTVDVDIHHNTFVNTAGKHAVKDGVNQPVYFVQFQNGVKGTVDVTSNLFGGSNNVTIAGLLKSNQVKASYSNNYACSDWRATFNHVEEKAVYDIVEETSTSSAVFTDLAAFDLTLRSGTTAFSAAAGDLRWIPTASAGLKDLVVEETIY